MHKYPLYADCEFVDATTLKDSDITLESSELITEPKAIVGTNIVVSSVVADNMYKIQLTSYFSLRSEIISEHILEFMFPIYGKNPSPQYSRLTELCVKDHKVVVDPFNKIISSQYTALKSRADSALAEFQTVYIVSGIAGMLSLLIALKLLAHSEKFEKVKSLKGSYGRFLAGIKEVGSDKRVLITSNMEGLQNMTVGALEAFLPIYAVKVAGLNEFQAGLLWGIQVLATILSKPIMGKASDRYGRKPLITIGMLLCAVSFGSVPLLRDFYLLMLAAIVFGFGEAFVTSSSAALVADICKEKHFGTAMGTFGTIFDIGHASGPIVAGILIARFDYLYSFWIMSAILVLAVPVFVMNVKLTANG